MKERRTTAPAAPLPVTIVTGFLGSGKTTLLNRLLKRPALADTVVIVNEFGEVGLDHLLIEQAIENTVLLKNGCICCTVRGDVADTLETLWRQRAAASIPPFSRIVIETTGLADPGSVAHALIAEPGASYACRLDGIVTTFDALHGPQEIGREEVQRQVALADVVLLTKTDLVADAAAAQRAIAAWNPAAPVRIITHGEADDADIFGLSPSGAAEDAASEERIARWLNPHGQHAHQHFHHDQEIASVLLSSVRPVAWDRLCAWLNSVLSLRGADILRIKGLVDVGEAAPVVLQAVHHVVHPPGRLPAWPGGPRGTQLVVIHQGLPASGLQASFAAALV